MLILKEAFKCFPFNINVYKKLIEYNLLGDNEWETIKIIGLDERIKKEMLQKIENEYSNKSDIKEIFDSIVSIYDYLPSELQTQINIEKCLAPIYVELKSRYLKAKNVIQSHDNLLCWIEENVSCDIENIPVEKVNEYVERYADCVIPEHIYSGLQNLKLPNNKTEWLNGGEFLTVKGEFCNCLSTQMLSFIDEVEKKKFAFMEAERKYKEKIEGLDSEIAHISSKIDSTGMLALRKRSELKKLIKQLENEKNTCLEFHTMENCKNEYEELFARTM